MKRIRPDVTGRARRRIRIRSKISGTQVRPRLSVFRSNSHIYAQVIDDALGTTLVAASTKDKDAVAFFNANIDKAVIPPPEQPAEGETQGKGKVNQKAQVQAAPSEGKFTKLQEARLVGMLVAQRAREKGIEKVVFDRGGYLYHGRIQALADGARAGGLQF